MLNIEKDIRKLARSPYYLRLFSSAKDLGTINLFDNVNNYSGLQVLFLYYLEMYSMLYKELSEQEWVNLDEKVIENDIRCDAFIYWRSKQIKKELVRHKEDMKKMSKKNKRASGKGESMNVYQGNRK